MPTRARLAPLEIVAPGGWLGAPGLNMLLAQRPEAPEQLMAGGTVRVHFQADTKLHGGEGLRLLSWCNQLAALGCGRLELVFPPTSELFRYLDRNGWLALLDPAIETSPPRPTVSNAEVYRGKSPGLVEIIALAPGSSAADRQEIVPHLVERLGAQYVDRRAAKRLKAAAFTVLGELIDNVFSHSQTAVPGYVMLQAYPNSARPRVQVAVSDSGIGVPASLRPGLPARLQPRSDAELLVEVFEQGLSRLGANAGRGCGLHRCAQLTNEHHARIIVDVPGTHVSLQRAIAATVLVATGGPVGYELAGTHVCMELRLDRIAEG